MTYDLSSLNLPILAGRSLRTFASLLDNRATRSALLPNLLSSGGIPKLRTIPLDEAPCFYPLAREAAAAVAHATTPVDWQQLQDAIAPQTGHDPLPGVADYARAYRDGTTTPTAVAERFLAALETDRRSDLPLNPFIAVNRDDLLAQARAATERIQAGRPLSLFDGVPVAVKDELDMLPYPTTLGTTFLGEARPVTADSTAVARLRAAGALLLGKANMYEIGISPESLNVHYGTARNPHSPQHQSGGSSSGPATATAAGLCPVALGADGGGSIRVPAALCGLVGLKATFGRVSERGTPGLDWSVAHNGPIGASVADVALAYAAIAGPDPHDPMSLAQPPVSLDGWQAGDLSGVRLGVYERWFHHASDAIVAANVALLARLEQAGATVRRIEVPGLDAIRIAHAATILSEMAAALSAYPQHWNDLSPATRVSLTVGKAMTSQDYLRAQQVRARALATFAALFEEVDAIVTPTTAVVAPPIAPGSDRDGWSNLNQVTELMRFAVAGNLTGLPAISFPAGYDSAGLPIGMQVMGRHWEEHLLLRIAAVAEKMVERRRARVSFDLLNG